MENLVINDLEQRHFFQWKKPEAKVEVFYGNLRLASSKRAILIKEVGREVYDGVYYLPMEDVNLDLFLNSTNHSHCPIKGDAKYLSLKMAGGPIEDIAWYYPQPIKKSSLIKNYLAFYPHQVKITVEPIRPGL